MSVYFKICSCQRNNVKLWEVFSQDLKKVLETEVKLDVFKKFPEDLKDRPDLFYASFSLSLHLVERNYIPIAKFKNQADYYLALFQTPIDKLRDKERIKIFLINRSILFYFLFYIIVAKVRINFSKIQPIIKDSYEEVEKELLNGSGDIYLLPEKRAKPYLEKFSFVEKIPFKVSHYFMVPSESTFSEKIKHAVFSIDKEVLDRFGWGDIEEVGEFEKEFLKICSFLSRIFPHLVENCTILDTFLNAPFFGIAIYHRKILYLNPYFCKMLGYSPEEIKNLAIWDVLYYEKDKERAKEIVERRVKGEYFFASSLPAILKTKDGKKLEVLIFGGTIFYQNKYCGFIVGIDITELRKLHRFLDLLRHVNQILVACNYEEEIYKKVLPVICKSLNLNGAWISDTEGRVLYKYPDDFEPVENFEVSKKKGIYFFYIPPYHLCVVPLIRDRTIISFLNLISEEKELFEGEIKDLLRELQEDLSLALTKVVLLEKDLVLRNFAEKSDELFLIADEDGNIEYINPAGRNILGFKNGNILKQNCFKLFSIPREILKKRKDTTRFVIYFKPDKTRLVLELKISFAELTYKTKIVIIGRDLTKELEFEREKEKLQYQDTLTGHLNRRGFIKRCADLIGILNVASALFIIDFYNFSYINHFYGFEVGDFCLKEIAKRLQEVLGDRGLLGRTGGDEFSLFIINVLEEGLAEWIKRIRNAFKTPISYKNLKLSLDWNMGVVVFPQDGENMEVLWKKVNLVLVEAKKHGPNTVEIYNPDIEREVEKTFKAEVLIKRAISEDLFVFYYQPYFEAKTLKIAGAEALVRIRENNELIPPSKFISILETSPYLFDFGILCFEKNIKKIEKWKIPISINISSQSFKILDFLNLLNRFSTILTQFPYFLQLEITEHTLAENVELAKRIINTIKFFKVKVALDDFGTGYSSLNYLKDFPIDTLKIDISFIKDMVKDSKTYYIVANIISLSHFLGIKVVAEGVETEEQLKILRDLDCDYIQGFLLSKPLPEEEIEKLLKEGK